MSIKPSLRILSPVSASKILGFGSAQPNRIVTNDDLTRNLDTSDEWIRERVGVVTRRLAEPGQSLVDLAVEAGAKAIADSGLQPSDMDVVLVANCTMPTPIPNAAAQTAYRIGMSSAAAFDLNAACAGFCYALGIASDLVRSGTARHVLVIGAERLSDWIDWQDRSTCIIFGDAAGAAVVGPADQPHIGPVAWGSAGDLAHTITIADRSSFIHQEGQAVFRWATTQIIPTAFRALELAGLQPSDVDAFIPHQANLRIIESLAKKLHSAGARENMLVAQDIVHSGNTSSASIPLAIDHLRAAGKISSSDVLLLVGFGAGLSYAAQVVICP